MQGLKQRNDDSKMTGWFQEEMAPQGIKLKEESVVKEHEFMFRHVGS